MDVHFNERFSWEGPTQLKEEYHNALVKGLPFPILTIVEYMAVDAEGFCWGRTYRDGLQLLLQHRPTTRRWRGITFW